MDDLPHRVILDCVVRVTMAGYALRDSQHRMHTAQRDEGRYRRELVDRENELEEAKTRYGEAN